MGHFYYNATALPASLVSLAHLFDAIATICYRKSCDGQREAWKRAWHNQGLGTRTSRQLRLLLIDSSMVNVQLRLPPWKVRIHGAVNSIAHGEAVLRLWARWPRTRAALFLEDDFRAIVDDASALDWRSLKSFVDHGLWRVLRIGYNPIGVSDTRPATHNARAAANATFGAPGMPSTASCPRACSCRRVSAAVCEVVLEAALRASFHTPYCDVRSAVAYAVHARAYGPLTWWRNQTVRGASRTSHRFKFLNDLWMTSTLSPMHYLVPALVTDSSPGVWKQGFVDRMRRFASVCVT
mmetsp:Transcript_23055/g.49761  ORF Transcript_23055/g.49761 Transcript_23055/m.49761 type:complete len:295 (-) Transcript_23055:86-970(-)